MQNTSEAQLVKIGEDLINQMKNLEVSKDWKVVEEKPIPIYKFQNGERVAIFAKNTLNLPFEVVVQFFSNPYYSKALSDMIKKCDVLFDNKVVRVINSIINIPAPMVSDRQMVVVNTVLVEGTKAYIGNRSCKYPFKKHKDTVMIEVHAAGYIIQKINENSTRVCYLSDQDVGGSIPNFLKNIMVTKRPAMLLTLQKKIKEFKK